jgi:hypothetical protein
VARSIQRDKQLAEARLAGTGLDVTTVYAVGLTNRAPSDDAVVRDVAAVSQVNGFPRISRADVARAIAVADVATAGQGILVSSAGTVTPA